MNMAAPSTFLEAVVAFLTAATSIGVDPTQEWTEEAPELTDLPLVMMKDYSETFKYLTENTKVVTAKFVFIVYAVGMDDCKALALKVVAAFAPLVDDVSPLVILDGEVAELVDEEFKIKKEEIRDSGGDWVFSAEIPYQAIYSQ